MYKTKTGILFLYHTLLLSFFYSPACAQDINGLKIDVANDAITILKFNAQITRYEFGTRDAYSCKVRDDDNSLVLKTSIPRPANSNLVVTEGKRTHYFIINFLPKIDLNNIKLYYNFSDLKALKKLVDENGANTVTVRDIEKLNNEKKAKEAEERIKLQKEEELKKANDAKRIAEAEKEKKRQMEEEKNKRLEEQKAAVLAKEKEKQRLINEKKELEEAKEKERLSRLEVEKEKQAAKDREMAAAKEKEQLRQIEIEREKKAAKDREIAEAKEKERLRQIEIDKKKKVAKEKEMAAAKEKERLRQIEIDKEKKAANDREWAAAQEKERLRQIKVAKEKQAAVEKELAEAKEKDRLRLLEIEKEKGKEMAAKEKERLRLLAIEREKKAAKDREIAEAKEKERLRLLAIEKEKKAAKDREIAEAKEKERLRVLQIEKDKKAAKDKEIAEAKEKERLRLLEIEIAKQLAKEQELAEAKEKERLRQIQIEKERLEALDPNQKLAIPYTQAQLFKKYPTIIYNHPPPGQLMTYDYITDSLENSRISATLLSASSPLNYSDSDKNTTITLQNISFSGANTYLKLHIKNSGSTDFLTGAMMVYWQNSDTTVKKLWASYVSAFPIVLPGKEISFVYAFHTVNAGNNDKFIFKMKDRAKKTELQINMTGKLYNDKMDQLESDRAEKKHK